MQNIGAEIIHSCLRFLKMSIFILFLSHKISVFLIKLPRQIYYVWEREFLYETLKNLLHSTVCESFDFKKHSAPL